MKRFCLFIAFAALLTLGRLTAQAQTTPPANVIITLTGDNFTRQSTVFIGTAQFTPEFVSANMLRVSIPRTMLSSAQPNNVRVVNPSAGGGSSQGLPLVVACRTNGEPNQLADFSMTIKTTVYCDLSEPMNESALTEGQKMNLTLSRMPYQSKVVVSGTYFRDGNADVQISFVPTQSLASPDIPLTTPAAIRTVFLKSSQRSVKFFTAANTEIISTAMDSVPFKPIMERLNDIIAQINALQNPSTTGTTTTASVQPAPADSNVRKSLYLSDAYREGFQITPLASGRYSVMITPKPNIPLAANEAIRMRVKTPEDIVERYEIFRDDLLQYRVRYVYDAATIQNPLPRLRETIATSFYVIDGLPMKQVSVEEYEDYTINLTQ